MTADPEHLQKAKANLEEKVRQRRARDLALHAQAVHEAQAIIAMIVRDFSPQRIYQWGSVVRAQRFRDYSDIDIAVEGITKAELFFDLIGKAQDLTTFSLDIVQMEKIEPEFAEEIRSNGRLVYERS